MHEERVGSRRSQPPRPHTLFVPITVDTRFCLLLHLSIYSIQCRFYLEHFCCIFLTEKNLVRPVWTRFLFSYLKINVYSSISFMPTRIKSLISCSFSFGTHCNAERVLLQVHWSASPFTM